MAISTDIYVSQLLDAWQKRMVEDEWNFAQIVGSGTPVSPCGVYVQSDRDMIADALLQATNMMAEILGYWPYPVYITDEREAFGRGNPYSLEQLKTQYGYLQALGKRKATLIQAAVPVVYSDADGDGYLDTATMTVNTTIPTSQIQVFFQASDLDAFSGIDTAAADERFRIQYLKMSVAAGVVTIRGRRSLFVHPETIWAIPYTAPNFVDKNAGDNTNANHFVLAVDVYQITTDPTSAIQILTDPIWVSSTGLDVFTATDAVMQIVDAPRGIFRARVNGCVGWDCLGPPERLALNYLAGVPLSNGQVDRELEIAIIRLANTLMPPNPLCSWCAATLNRWTMDNVIVEGQEETPFGKLTGAVHAWRVVSGRANGKGGAL
jgi:hypothetical protein